MKHLIINENLIVVFCEKQNPIRQIFQEDVLYGTIELESETIYLELQDSTTYNIKFSEIKAINTTSFDKNFNKITVAGNVEFKSSNFIDFIKELQSLCQFRLHADANSMFNMLNDLSKANETALQTNKKFDNFLDDYKKFPSPILNKIKLTQAFNEVKKFRLYGSYLTPVTKIVIDDLTVVTDFISSEIIEVTITAKDILKKYNLTIISEFGENTYNEMLDVRESNWIDLREGGSAIKAGITDDKDLIIRSGMVYIRDKRGIYFMGIQRWKTIARFNKLKWKRSEETKTIEFIMTAPQGAMMLGLGTDERNNLSTSQWKEHDLTLFFNSPTSYWGLYGHNVIPNSYVRVGSYAKFDPNSVLKIRIENNGNVGAYVKVYVMPNETDWDAEGTLIVNQKVSNKFPVNSETIMPVLMPFSGVSQRFIAIKVE
ncbi:hypothetical protein HYO65_gp253 [Tenacibaculum phage PTm1]|uniref:Uncharacterized protein n=2 Tax=Shirahamavirus PTm1 TaxID=2846435 RepID=A0A5S9HXE4_9CAUD|nr:hypothetical protein HYO65_gp253 [Tenacibaculum phage PTm1]BBI90645.1 hypothetical protein [Tenacibaculum phage PTm1]BBI90951.1 hypothetical protein [Tenacibaculum phage PTm5]